MAAARVDSVAIRIRGVLRHRLIFGTLMIAAAVGLFYLDDRLDDVRIAGWASDLMLGRDYPPSGLVLLLVVLGVIVLAGKELSRLFQSKGVRVSGRLLGFAGWVGILAVYAIPFRLDSQATLALYTTCIVGVFVLALLVYARRHETQGALTAASAALLALIYLGTLPGFLLAIRRWHSAWVVVGIILVIKASDIGAYFTGRAIGRHKLIPWLSPGKTWEGLAGGVAMSALVAVGLVALSNELGVSGRYVYDEDLTSRRFAASDYPLWLAAIAGGLLALAGVLGDLTASLFKRDAGLKDSGKSIPGFGGVLDVIDSLVLAAPVAYWMIRLMHVVG